MSCIRDCHSVIVIVGLYAVHLLKLDARLWFSPFTAQNPGAVQDHPHWIQAAGCAIWNQFPSHIVKLGE